MTNHCRSRLATLVAAVLGLTGAVADDVEPLVRSGDVSQFELVGIGPASIRIANDEIRLSGQPEGYFATKKEYKN
jgi:hypothetical protein